VREHGVQEGAEHVALRDAGVESQGGACVGSARQEVQNPVTQGGVDVCLPISTHCERHLSFA